MTALRKYDRIEASALWRPAPGEQRREVIISMGDATLLISDPQDRPITHWSLAALDRVNPGKKPAIYSPDGDPGDTLELAPGEDNMIEAIETLRRAVHKARPHPGRLRSYGALTSAALVISLGLLWLPGALVNHAVTVVPKAKRIGIGDALLARIERLSGARCDDPAGLRSLQILRARIGTGPLAVLPDSGQLSLHLPGGRILLRRDLVEDFEDPAVVAGFALAEYSRAQSHDPLRDLLRHAGVWSTFRLLTTGDLPQSDLAAYAQHLLTAPTPDLAPEPLLQTFRAANLSSAPYAYALDVTGESVLPLIEGDPQAALPPALIMTDADWLRLQNICGG
jgi:hypothetical protein